MTMSPLVPAGLPPRRNRGWVLGASLLLHALLAAALFAVARRPEAPMPPPSYDLVFEGAPGAAPPTSEQQAQEQPPSTPSMPASPSDATEPAPAAPAAPAAEASPPAPAAAVPAPPAPVAAAPPPPPIESAPGSEAPAPNTPPVPDAPPSPAQPPPPPAQMAMQEPPPLPAEPPPTPVVQDPAPPAPAPTPPLPTPPLPTLPAPEAPPPPRAVPEVRLEPPAAPPPPPVAEYTPPAPPPPLPQPPRPPAPPPRPRAAPPPAPTVGTLSNPMDLNFRSAAARPPAARLGAAPGSVASRSIDLSLGAPKPGPNKQEAFFDARAAKLGADWMQGVRSFWLQHRYYPLQAAEHGEDGNVDVELVVNRYGRVQSATVKSRSGSPWLDMAAAGTFRGAQLPPLPAEVEAPYTVTLTINYILLR